MTLTVSCLMLFLILTSWFVGFENRATRKGRFVRHSTRRVLVCQKELHQYQPPDICERCLPCKEHRNLHSLILAGKTKLYFPFCGVRSQDFKIPSSPGKRIVGGVESAEGAWPWQVALLLNGEQMCGGSLVTPRWIVSAAHCFIGKGLSKNPEDWTVSLGEHHLAKREVFEQKIGVDLVITHPLYKNSSVVVTAQTIESNPPDYDIAVLRLTHTAKLDKFVYPICLLPNGKRFREGKECFVTGWGHTQYRGPKPDILREAKVRIVSESVCNHASSFGGNIHGRALCAGFEKGGVDACQYDSGGPLSCKDRGLWYLTGVVSWGHECGLPRKYGVYADMEEMTPWVKSKITLYT